MPVNLRNRRVLLTRCTAVRLYVAAVRLPSFAGCGGSGNSWDGLPVASSVTAAVRGLSSVSPGPDLARAERGGSRWNSATAKKQTIKTLKTMLGPTWRFMGVRAAGACLK